VFAGVCIEISTGDPNRGFQKSDDLHARVVNGTYRPWARTAAVSPASNRCGRIARFEPDCPAGLNKTVYKSAMQVPAGRNKKGQPAGMPLPFLRTVPQPGSEWKIVVRF